MIKDMQGLLSQLEQIDSPEEKIDLLIALSGELLDKDQKRAQSADSLQRTALALAQTNDLEETLNEILTQLGKLVFYDGVSVMLLSGGRLQVVAGQGLSYNLKDIEAAQLEDLFYIREVIEKGVPVVIPDTNADPHWRSVSGSEKVLSWLGVPLAVGKRVIGVLNLDKEQPGAYTTEHADLALAFAAHAAVAIEQARLYEDTQYKTDELIRSNELIIALSQVAARLQAVTKLDDVFKTLGNELKKIGITCVIGLSTPDDDILIKYTSIESKISSVTERLSGVSLLNFRMPYDLMPDELRLGRGLFSDPAEMTRRLLPNVPRAVLKKVLAMVGIAPGMPVAYIPLKTQEDQIGLLAVWGPDFQETDYSALEVLAAQAAAAIVQARLFDEIKTSQEKFSKAFMSSPDSVIISTLDDGRYLDVNESFLSTTGYSRGEIIGRTSTEFSIWADPADRDEFVGLLQEQGQVRNYETRYRKKSGKEGTVLMSSEIIEIDGKPTLLTITKDITERKRAARDLQESNRRYDALFNYSPDAVFILSLDGVHLDANQRAADMLGYELDELIGKSAEEIVDPREYPDSTAKLDALLSGQIPPAYERIFRRKDGLQVPVEISLTLVRDEHSQPLYIQSIVRDISERKELESMRQRYEFIANTNQDMMTLVNRDYVFEAANDAYCRAQGQPREGIVGQTVADIWGEDVFETIIRSRFDRCFNGEVVHEKAWLEYPTLGLRCAEITYTPFRDKSGEVGHAVVVTKDITEQEQAQAEVMSLAKFPDENTNPILRATNDGEILYANPAGYPLLESCGCEIGDLLPEKMMEPFSNASQSGETIETEIAVGEQTILFTIAPIKDAGYVNLYGRDVTERVQAVRQINAVFDTAPDAILVVDEDGLIQRANAQSEKIFGYKREELHGLSVDVLVPSQLRQKHVAHRRSFHADSHTRPMGGGLELSAQHKDGGEFPVEISLSALEASEGKLVTAIVRDISDQKRAQKEITRGYQEQTLLNELLQIGSQELPLQAQLEQALDAILEIPWLPLKPVGSIALAEEQTLVLTAHRNLPSEMHACCDRVPFGQCLCGQAAANQEIIYADHVDERHVTCYDDMPDHGHFTIPLVSEGKTIAVLMLFLAEGHQQDQRQIDFLNAVAIILAGMITRSQVSSERRKLSSVVEQTADAVVITDKDGIVQYVNPAFEEITGYAPDEVLGKNPRLVRSTAHDQAFYKRLWDTILAGETFRGTLINRKKNGELFHVDQTITPLLNSQGEIINFVSSWKDITDRVQAEAQIREHDELMGRLAKISEEISRSFTLEDVAAAIGKGALALSGADRAALYYRISADAITCLWYHNLSAGFVEQIVSRAGELPGSRLRESFEPILLRDVQSLSEGELYRRLAEEEGIRANGLWPLVYEGRVVAGVSCGFDAPRTWSEAEQEVMAAFAQQAAVALENARLYEEARRRLQNMQALHAIDLAISGSVDLNVTLNVLLDQVTSRLNVDAVAILLLDHYTQVLEFIAQRGFRTDALRHTRLRMGEGHAGRAVLENRIVHIKDLTTGRTDFLRSPMLKDENFSSYLGVPLTAKGQIQGVLEIFHRSSLDPDEEWMELVKAISTQAAIAIDNANLFKNLQRSNVELTLAYDTTLEGWAKALELRDEETEGHTRRVTAMTERLAREMGISEEEMVQVRRGALLHDIGKMGVPDSVLLKPGKLTEEEWVVMRQHPVHAYNFLSEIEYLRPALDIPYCHHEKWDGSGYPRGLKGEQIPLPARIFAVVDVWDALTSDRPYREAWEKERVLEYIREQSGTHFDPAVVEEFLSLFGGNMDKET